MPTEGGEFIRASSTPSARERVISSAIRTTWRVAVIGGGLSGLAAAHRLQELCARDNRPLDLVLFEAGAQLGGIVGTRSIAGYRVELGADSFITNKPWAVDLCRRLGIEDRLIPTDARYRRSLVLRNGKPVPVPEGFQLLAPVEPGRRASLADLQLAGQAADGARIPRCRAVGRQRRRKPGAFRAAAFRPRGAGAPRAAAGGGDLHVRSRETLAAGDDAALSRDGTRASAA